LRVGEIASSNELPRFLFSRRLQKLKFIGRSSDLLHLRRLPIPDVDRDQWHFAWKLWRSQQRELLPNLPPKRHHGIPFWSIHPKTKGEIWNQCGNKIILLFGNIILLCRIWVAML